jgi:hypothetical protein
MTGAALTEDTITTAMERAATRLRAGGPAQRLTLMPSRPVDALVTLTADGWVEIGVLVDPDHPHDWRVWLNVESGEGRLRPWARR